MPEEANKIKHLINGNGNKVEKLEILSDRSLPVESIMSDNELIDHLIKFLQGKGFDVTI